MTRKDKIENYDQVARERDRFMLAVNDQLNVIRGCDKTRGTCSSIFSNIARFGGFPDAPKPEGKL